MNRPSIVIAGSGTFAATVAERIWRHVDIRAVCAPGGSDRLALWADEQNTPVLPADALKGPNLPAGIDWPVDAIFAANHTAFIGRCRLQAKWGALGYHPSLLPRHRGRSSVEWTVRMGDPIAGGTVLQYDDGADTGPIVAQRHCFVDPGESASDLYRRALFGIGVDLFLEVSLLLAQGFALTLKPQPPLGATWEPALHRSGKLKDRA